MTLYNIGKLVLPIFFVFSIYGRFSVAATLEDQAKCLNVISDFADRLCGDIDMRGETEIRELSVAAKTELSGMLKALTSAGIQGAAKYEKETYKGVLQRDLASVINSSTDCRRDVFKQLRTILLPHLDASTANLYPKILSFEAVPSIITKGNVAQLRWNVQNAENVIVNNTAVALTGSVVVYPQTTTTYVLSATHGDKRTDVSVQIKVQSITLEQENSVGRLPGDEIRFFRILYATSPAPRGAALGTSYFDIELNYSYNPQHGRVWIGGYLLDEADNNLSGGFIPAAANPSGKSTVRVTLDQPERPIKWIFFWLYESYKGNGFVSKRFPM